MRIGLVAGLIAVACLAEEQGERFSLTFYPGKGARNMKLNDGPCGPVTDARVRRLPVFSAQGRLVTDSVFEVGPTGAIIHGWPMPVNARPVGVNGSRLLIEGSGVPKLWVTPSGELAQYRAQDPTFVLESEPKSCAKVKAFEGSAYVGCRVFRDSVSGARRTLVFEWPCA